MEEAGDGVEAATPEAQRPWDASAERFVFNWNPGVRVCHPFPFLKLKLVFVSVSCFGQLSCGSQANPARIEMRFVLF